MRKENIIYVGIDLHKETHTAVMLNCWNQKLGEITIENKPAEFHKLTRKVSRFVTEEKTIHLWIRECVWLWPYLGGVAD